jgi:NAD+ diphosphatase
VLVVSGARVRPEDGGVVWAAPSEVPDGLRILLGEREGRTWFAVVVDPAEAPGEPSDWVGLRAVLPALVAGPAGEAPLVFHALGLAEWHLATRFCALCGGPLESRSSGHELVCERCGKAQFPRTDPAVIMAVTYGEPGSPDEQILLGRQTVWPPGRFSTLAGFCEPGESLEDAVRREVREEVGVPVGARPGDRARPGRDRGRALVHPRRDAGRGRVRRDRPAQRRLDQPLPRRDVVRRPPAGDVVTRPATSWP